MHEGGVEGLSSQKWKGPLAAVGVCVCVYVRAHAHICAFMCIAHLCRSCSSKAWTGQGLSPKLAQLGTEALLTQGVLYVWSPLGGLPGGGGGLAPASRKTGVILKALPGEW